MKDMEMYNYILDKVDSDLLDRLLEIFKLFDEKGSAHFIGNFSKEPKPKNEEDFKKCFNKLLGNDKIGLFIHFRVKEGRQNVLKAICCFTYNEYKDVFEEVKMTTTEKLPEEISKHWRLDRRWIREYNDELLDRQNSFYKEKRPADNERADDDIDY